jgi:predicted nuclease of predicted toxin-antitoxin system
MRVKLDENFGTRTQDIFRATGHNVKTVWEEELHGCSDQKIFETCCAESRCLVTLDLDFADTVRFQPEKAAGIAVIRIPRNPSLSMLESLVRQFLKELDRTPINKKLWIVEIGRIRIHQSNSEDDI